MKGRIVNLLLIIKKLLSSSLLVSGVTVLGKAWFYLLSWTFSSVHIDSSTASQSFLFFLPCLCMHALGLVESDILLIPGSPSFYVVWRIENPLRILVPCGFWPLLDSLGPLKQYVLWSHIFVVEFCHQNPRIRSRSYLTEQDWRWCLFLGC